MFKTLRIHRALSYAQQQWNGIAMTENASALAKIVRALFQPQDILRVDGDITVVRVDNLVLATHTDRATTLGDSLVVPGIDEHSRCGYLVLKAGYPVFHTLAQTVQDAFEESIAMRYRRIPAINNDISRQRIKTELNRQHKQPSIYENKRTVKKRKAITAGVLAAALFAPINHAYALPFLIPLVFIGKGTVAAKGTAVAVTTAKAATAKAATAKVVAAKTVTAKAAAAKTTTVKSVGAKSGTAKTAGKSNIQQLQAELRAQEAQQNIRSLKEEVVSIGLEIVELHITDNTDAGNTTSERKKK